jgi:hypothetical protein
MHSESAVSSMSGKQYNVLGSDEQVAIWKALDNNQEHIMVNAVAGSGKCLGKSTPVLLYDGRIVPVETVKAGDWLMGPDSQPRIVITTNKGIGRLYRITPIKGDPWVCNENHILTLVGTNRFKGQTRDVALMDYRSESRCSQTQWKLWRTGVEWNENRTYEVEPYLVGLWLGDGTKTDTVISTNDEEIIKYLRNYADDHGLLCKVKADRTVNSVALRMKNKTDKGTHQRTIDFPLRRVLLAGCVKDGEKRIPFKYLITSIDQRLKLLAGLIDSDGYFGCGSYEIATKYIGLATDILFLARSLGFAAYISFKTVQLDEERTVGYYRISISGEQLELIPVLLRRKKAPLRKQIKRTNITGFTIEGIGVGEYYGFTLTGDGRFLLGDFTVTHNTWTIVEWAKAQTSGRIALVAFNKHIADELKLRLGNNKFVEPMTYHSLGFRQVKAAFGGKVQVDNYKVDGILDNIALPGFSENDEWKSKQVKWKIKKLVSLAKQYAVRDRVELERLVDHHDVELNGNEEVVYEYVPKVLDACKTNKSVVDFDDMVWLPSELGLSSKQYDVMCVDELQDTNIVQQYLALNTAHRIVGIGDEKQSIYGFRGADVNGMERIKNELSKTSAGCMSLPLNITRRCPKSHVELAKRIVPQITALDTADVGLVSTLKAEVAVNSMRPGDLVVCRVNAELLGVAYKLLKRGVKAVVRGRDLGAGLEKLIDKCIKKGANEDVRDLLDIAGQITNQETDKYLAIPHGRGEMRAANAQDRYGCLCELAVDCKTVSELRGVITRLFADFDDSGKPNNAVVLGTIHRTKGLEANRVFVLRGDLIPHPMAKQNWECVQEMNAAYIAVTRSKYELIWVGQPSSLFVD